MECANTQALNRHLQEQSNVENSFESLVDYLKVELANLQEDIEKILKISKDYDGFDFTEDMKILIKEMTQI